MSTIFRDDFTGAGSAPLAGTAPDGTGFGGFLWSVNSTFSLTRTGGQALGAQVSGSWNVAAHYGDDLTPDEIFTDASEFEATWSWACAAAGFGSGGIASVIIRAYTVGGGLGNSYQARIEYGTGSISSLELIVQDDIGSRNAQIYIPIPAPSGTFPASLVIDAENATLSWFGQTLSVPIEGPVRPLTSIDITTRNNCAFEFLAIDSVAPPAPPVPKWTDYQNTYEVL